MQKLPESLCRLVFVVVVIFAVAACQSVPGQLGYLAAPPAQSRSTRAGLGTHATWEVHDRANRVAFYRRSAVPSQVASFHYNDEAGATAMAKLLGGATRRSGLMELAGGKLRAGLERGGSVCPRLSAGGKDIVIGQAGSYYSIVLENRSSERVEAVVSVDGLNVLGGAPASMTQRGHLIEPKSRIELNGFRVNDRTVRRFEFSSVGESVAAAKGKARNVGVIGIALFEEDAVKAAAAIRSEQFVREDASAFPVAP
jgi:hypothetical protein